MKKIYIFAAVLALLTLSLNAQDGVKVIDNATIIEKAPKLTATANNQSKSLTATTKAGNFSFYEMLSGIKGMSSVLQAGQDHTTYSANGQSRAPLRLNSDEVTVGPFEGDNFSTNGLGFPTAYGDNPQQIYITTELDRNEFIDHNGDEIVGFRFALAGNSSQKAVLYDFIAWPHSNGYFSQDRYTWTISEFNETPDVSTTFDDIVITVPGNSVVFSEITVYDQDNNVLTTWNANSTDTYTVTTSSGGTATAYNLPTGWTLQNVYMFRWSNSGNYYGYLSTSSQSSITIDASYLDGCTSAHVVIGAMGDYGTETLDVNGDTRNVTTEIVSYNFNLSPTGGGTPIYVELEGGQWHEFYLDEPIPFNVADSIIGMRMGYGYFQYPSTETSELLYPIAVNPNSTSHNHISYMVKQNGTTTGNQLLTGWNYATDARNFPSTWTVPSMGSGSISGSLYFGSSSGANIVIPASDLQGLTNVTVKVTAGKENNSTHTLTVNGVATSSALTTSLLEYTWDNVNASSGITIHVSDWYVDISKIEVYGMLTVPNYQQGWWTEDFSQYGDLAVQLIFKNTTNPAIEISPATQTINDAAAGTLTVTGTDIDGNINVSASNNDWYLNPTSLGNTGGDVNVSYTGTALSASTTVTASATGATDATATVDYLANLYIVGDFGNGWDFNNGTQMTYANGTYTATLTVNANAYILFARLLGNNNPWGSRDVLGPVSGGDWWMQGNSATGNLDLNPTENDPIYFTESGTYRITVNVDGTFTITKLNGEQTAPPVITSSSDGEYVTITATGNGTVTLNVPGYDSVSGEGEVSITIPCGVVNNTITVSATAQEAGKDESDPATAQINIPAGSDWVEMDGTYNNPTDLLSFLKDGEDIMLIDQFLESTFDNEHPDHYTYTLRQTVNGETQTSTPVTIPVYKTNSTMQGLYTYNQVTNVDKNMSLKANVVNTEMDFDVNPDRNVLYYSLYRGNLNATYPEITAQARISQLQKFEEIVGDYPQYYLFESHPTGIAPRYERTDYIGSQMVERLDTNWVEAAYDDQLAYVPVIWTYGLYTARGDGKNNSYGSDIKREYMGKVEAEITGEYTDVNGSNGAYSTFDVNGVDYIIYHPIINVTGYLPQNNNNNEVDYNDGDVAHYVPYLCRAWCTYEGIRDFGRDADGNLMDLGELPTPFLLGEATIGSDMTATIGGLWTGGSERDPWSFGVPASTDPQAVTFKIRFYYKKVVTDAQAQQNGGNGKFIGDAAEEYFMAETDADGGDIEVVINELMNGPVPVSVTYINPQGMQSSRPFDGVNIVVTRYSDGTTRTSKIIR